MKQLIVLMTLLSLLSAGVALADNAKLTYVAADLFASVEDDYLGSGEYAWNWGRVSGYGYAEVGEEGTSRWFSNHLVDVPLSGDMFVSVEVGAADFGEFLHTGIGLNLTSALGAEESFVFLKVIYYFDAGGDVGAEQLKLVWLTKQLELGKFNFWSEGYHRIRRGIPDTGQPQLMFSHDRLPQLSYGVEIENFDGKHNFRWGLKWSWSS